MPRWGCPACRRGQGSTLAALGQAWRGLPFVVYKAKSTHAAMNRAIHLNDAPRGSDAIDVLNVAGGEGWELIGITANNIAYKKRQIAAPAPSSPRRKAATDVG